MMSSPLQIYRNLPYSSKINQDPEDSAWFFKLKIKDHSEMDTLMNKDDYDKFAKETSA